MADIEIEERGYLGTSHVGTLDRNASRKAHCCGRARTSPRRDRLRDVAGRITVQLIETQDAAPALIEGRLNVPTA